MVDVDTLAQRVMRAVRAGDAAALEGYWTRWRPPVAQSRVTIPFNNMHDAGD